MKKLYKTLLYNIEQDKIESRLHWIFLFLITITFGIRGIQLGPLKFLEIFLIIYIIANSLNFLIKKQKIKIYDVYVAIYIFFINILIGIILNGQTEDTFMTMGRLIIGVLIFILFSKRDIKYYMKSFSYGFLFTANYLFLSNFKHIIDFLSGSYSGEFVGRMSIASSFGNPNFFSNFLLIPFSISVCYLMRGIINKKRFTILYNLLTIISIVIMIVNTLSRGSIISLIIITIIYLYWFAKKTKFNIKYLIILITIVVILSSLFYSLWSNTQGSLTQRFSHDQIISGSGRNYIFKDAINTFLSHPIFGVGLGNFKNISVYKTRTHNLYLELLVETGLIGFITFSFIIYKVFKASKRNINNVPYTIALIGLLLNGLTINMLDLRHIWLIMGILLSSRDFNDKIKSKYF